MILRLVSLDRLNAEQTDWKSVLTELHTRFAVNKLTGTRHWIGTVLEFVKAWYREERRTC